METTTPHKTRKITRLSLFKSRTMLADLAEWQGPTLIPPDQTLRDTALWHILAGMAWKHQERIYKGPPGIRDELDIPPNIIEAINNRDGNTAA